MRERREGGEERGCRYAGGILFDEVVLFNSTFWRHNSRGRGGRHSERSGGLRGQL